MVDRPSSRTPRDRSRVNVEDDEELRYWMGELYVDEQTLRNTVKAVGPMLDDVRREIGRNLARGEDTGGRP